MSEHPVAARFPTTQWSLVARAGNPADPAARAALEALCRDYWFPLYAFVRGKGHPVHEAEDLVQGFLADLLERGDLADLDRSKGRFRAFLRVACEHYLANRREHDRAAKRGGEVRIVTIDRLKAESRYGHEPAHSLTPERLFERQWAITLLARVLDRLEAEAAEAGKSALFEQLCPALQGDDLAASSRAVGDALGMSEGAVRVATYRLRARYRELLSEEIVRTIEDPNLADEEIADLRAALSAR
jgi:RNA polymerase sigma-70 factor (ECF subfamily)